MIWPCLFVTGGKAYGLLKNHQEDKLNAINEVKLQSFIVNLYIYVFDVVCDGLLFYRLFSQILSMQKRRTLDLNLKCLKVSGHLK